MRGKLLIVEDEPIVALDLQQEVEAFGLTVTGLAESADAALTSVEDALPDLVLMDIRIDGSMDGIQTARLLRHAYQVPVVFLSSYSDKVTLTRASRELPYGYLTKPFRSRELQATLNVALHKAVVDAEERASSQFISMTIHSMHEAIMLVSAQGIIQYMNQAAEEITAIALLRARGMHLSEVLALTDIYRRSIPLPFTRGTPRAIELFGWFLQTPGRERLTVDFTVRSLVSEDGEHGGHVLTIRDAAERMRQKLIEASISEDCSFDNSSIAMVQLDGEGRVMRINQKLLSEIEVPMEKLVGRKLTELIEDSDPRITQKLIYGLLQPFRPAHQLLAQE